jgi:hypothetical protein
MDIPSVYSSTWQQSGPLKCKYDTLMLKTTTGAGHWWLTPVILTTQEAEIRRIAVQNQPRQIVLQNPISKNPSQK